MDLAHLAEQVLALYQPGAPKVGVETDFAARPTVTGDAELLARALGNVVANALEAMPEGGTLRVRTLGVPGGAAVEVEDTGPGLSEEQLSRLFTPYHTTKPGGTGLGLVIAQGIAVDHGGRIEAASSLGHGATFRLVLPRASAS